MTTTKKRMGALAGAVVGGLTAASATAAPFTAGNVAVYRVGDGAAALASGVGAATFIDEYTAAGTLVQSIAVPTVASGSNQALVNSGTATSEGLLSLSPNGQYLAFAGNNTAVGTANSSTTGTINKTIGIVDGNGAVNTSTVLTDVGNTNNIRSAVTTDGTTIYVGSAVTGVRTTTVGSTTSTQLSTTVTNVRQVNVFGGQLFTSSQSGTIRLGTVGTGTPTTTGQTITNLPGLPTTNTGAGGNPYSYLFLDLDPAISFGTTGLDTLYVADNSAGITKFGFNGTTFAAQGAVADAGLTGLTGSATAGVVSLFTSTGTALQLLTDSSGAAGTLTGTPTSLATAGANTAFRGVAFAPTATTLVPEPATLGAAAVVAAGLLARRRNRA